MDVKDNLSAWNALARPPKEALKAIKGGRLSGMTDINPTWRLKAMTEVYGPVGTGWWYTIDGFDTHDMAGEVALLARITLYIAGREHGIPGVGGSMLVASEKGGMRLSDEAWKMAVTDALSVAMKALGVGAEVYMGNWDGSKYRNSEPTPEKPKVPAELLDSATKAARLGIAAYQAFWRAAGKDGRALLESEHGRLKGIAADFDAAREGNMASQP